MSRKRDSAPAPQDGTVNPDLLAQLSATLWLPHDLDETEKAARMAAASTLLADTEPAAGIESMIVVQMVATHVPALECLRRSMAPGPWPASLHRGRCQSSLLDRRGRDRRARRRGRRGVSGPGVFYTDLRGDHR